MQPVIDKFSDPLDGSTKYSRVKLIDRVDIEAFIGILYLGTAFKLNILDKLFGIMKVLMILLVLQCRSIDSSLFVT